MFIRSPIRSVPRRRRTVRGVVRSLRRLVKEALDPSLMDRDDWKLLAEERGAKLVEAQRESVAYQITARTYERALKISDARLQEALSLSAKWEIEAADLRDRLVEGQRERDAIRQQRDDWQTLLESERAAWRAERAEYLAEVQRLREKLWRQAQVRTGATPVPPPPPAAPPRKPDAYTPPLEPKKGRRQHDWSFRAGRQFDLACTVCKVLHDKALDEAECPGPRPAAGQGSGPGGAANVVTSTVLPGDEGTDE